MDVPCTNSTGAFGRVVVTFRGIAEVLKSKGTRCRILPLTVIAHNFQGYDARCARFAKRDPSGRTVLTLTVMAHNFHGYDAGTICKALGAGSHQNYFNHEGRGWFKYQETSTTEDQKEAPPKSSQIQDAKNIKKCKVRGFSLNAEWKVPMQKRQKQDDPSK